MNKNTVAGLVVVGLILFGFSWWQNGRQKKYDEAVASEAVVSPTQTPVAAVVEPVVSDSINRVRLGDVLAGSQATAGESVVIENDVMSISFNTRGAYVEQVELKEYSKYGLSEPLKMYAPESAHLGMQFWLAGNQMINTADHTFIYKGIEEGAAVFSLPVDSLGGAVEFRYTLPESGYMVDLDVRFVGMGDKLSNQMSSLVLDWGATLPQQEKGFANENNYSYVAYKAPSEDKVHDIGKRKTDAKIEQLTGNVEWIAMKQQFFTTTLLAKNNFQNAEVAYETLEEGSGLLKKFTATANVAYNSRQADYGFRLYVGPVKYSILRSYDARMERLVALGGWSLVRWVNVGLVIPVFNFLTKHIASMGLIILLLTLMIKIIILPLTYKSYLSMAKMRVLKPEVDALNERYPKQEDALKKQQATMELYRKAGASPMGGCLPMLIQFPIIIALFYFFPTAIELRGQSFLWAEDLSTYDSVLNLGFNIPWYGAHVSLFALLMAVTLWINTRLTSKTQPSGPGAGMMKSMMYMMPVMMLLFFNNYSSGLTYYYTLSNIITIATTLLMQWAVDDQKLHAQMKAKSASKKSKPKSKWQQRYEDAVKQQQQMRKK